MVLYPVVKLVNTASLKGACLSEMTQAAVDV